MRTLKETNKTRFATTNGIVQGIERNTVYDDLMGKQSGFRLTFGSGPPMYNAMNGTALSEQPNAAFNLIWDKFSLK